MNHLAHFKVAHPERGLVVGAFLGDFVKGRLKQAYPPDIERGIRLHRAVDAYTDQHEIVLRSVSRFNSRFRRYAPILVDVIFDHFLASTWDQHHRGQLEDFSDEVFGVVLGQQQLLPERAAEVAGRMQAARSMVRYRHADSLPRTFAFIGSRLKRANPLHEAAIEFERLEAELNQDFELFFPELLAFTREWQQQN